MPDTALTIATWNMHKGIGSDRRRDLARTTNVIAEIAPDIMALQEADLRFGSRAGLLDLDHLHHRTGLSPVLVDTPGPSHGWHGNLILLRKGTTLQTDLIRLPGLEPRGALVAEVDLTGRALRIVAAHFGLLRRSRRHQVHALLDHLDRRETMPTLLMGDLNEWRSGPGSPLTPLIRHFRPAPAIRSFPARFPILPLDRLMIGPMGEITDLATHDTPLARRASDHLPLKGRLILPDSGGTA
jgi:endonuclease/exonuclease/phosphatase family metal-dependent hydrolase